MSPALLIEKPPQQTLQPSKAHVNIREDYEGNYKFAPICEAEVSRAMIKRLVFIFKPFKGVNLYGGEIGTSTQCTTGLSQTS